MKIRTIMLGLFLSATIGLPAVASDFAKATEGTFSIKGLDAGAATQKLISLFQTAVASKAEHGGKGQNRFELETQVSLDMEVLLGDDGFIKKLCDLEAREMKEGCQPLLNRLEPVINSCLKNYAVKEQAAVTKACKDNLASAMSLRAAYGRKREKEAGVVTPRGRGGGAAPPPALLTKKDSRDKVMKTIKSAKTATGTEAGPRSPRGGVIMGSRSPRGGKGPDEK